MYMHTYICISRQITEYFRVICKLQSKRTCVSIRKLTRSIKRTTFRNSRIVYRKENSYKLMAPQVKVEIVILKLTYLPFIHPQCPRISLIRNKRYPSRAMYDVRSWFDHIIFREKSKVPSNLRVRFCECIIKSGNASLFEAKGYRYDKILVILGEERVHWLFYTNTPVFRRSQGWCALPLNYCGCCLDTQYIKIIETIKCYMLQ